MAGRIRVTTAAGSLTFRHQHVVIGRDQAAHVTIDDIGVSRRHVVLEERADGWWAVDQQSRNGTYADGRALDALALAPGVTELRLADPASGPLVTIEVDEDRDDTGARVATGTLVGGMATVTAVHTAERETIRIGRAPDNDVVVDDLAVSRYHAEILLDTAGAELVDLSSHNGSFVNGLQVERSPLQEFDLVTIGHHLFRYVAGALEQYVDAGDIQLEARDLEVRIPDGPAILQGVSLSIPERSLVAILGPSGSGKSTLVKALSGFRPADGGQVLYSGRDLYQSYDDVRQRIGYVPQDDILHPELTVRQALGYAARLRFPPDVSQADIDTRVTEVIDELGLTHRADVRISLLSGGQRKRASVGFELLTRPSLLILDEPTSGLDPGYERSLTRLLRTLADGGRTILVVTHSVQSLDLCDRNIILAPGGRLAYFGPPDAALPYFDAESYSEVYEELGGSDGDEWRERFEQSPLYSTYVDAPRSDADPTSDGARDAPEPIKRRGWLRQYLTLTRRYLAVLLQDPKFITLLALQAPLIGLIMIAAFPPNQLQPRPDAAPPGFSTATFVLAVLVLAVTWVGMSNAAREVAKEIPIYRRERAVGLSTSAYVLSKVTVLTLFTVTQAFVLVGVGLIRQGVSSEAAAIPPGILELALAMSIGGIAALSLGLFISAVAANPDRAVSLLPVILVLQLLLSGAIKDLPEQPGMRELSYLSSAQWTFSAAAATTDLGDLQLFNDCVGALESVLPEDAPEILRCAVEFPEYTRALATATGPPLELEACRRTLRGFEVIDLAGLDLGAPTQAARCALSFPEEALPDELREEILEGGISVNDDHPFRFWAQDAADWTLNVTLLGALSVASIAGAWHALRRFDKS